MSDFSLSSVYLTVSLFVLPHGTSKPIASGTVIPKIFAVRFSAALFFLLKILLVGAINKFRISSKFVMISGISVAEIAELGSGISVSGSAYGIICVRLSHLRGCGSRVGSRSSASKSR